jgi:hypothetical protein
VQSYGYAKKYCQQIEASIARFLDERKLSRLELLFDDLIVRPEGTLEKINQYLGTRLTVSDLQAVYNQPLYRAPRNALDFLKAGLIYARNFAEATR